MALPRRVKPTYEQEQALVEGRVAFMRFCPFFCHLFYDLMEEYFTDGVPGFATDGKRVFVNPAYVLSLKPPERATGYAHEMQHVILKHPQRVATYLREKQVKGVPYIPMLMNVAMDLVINPDLIDMGMPFNPSWLYDPRFSAKDLSEDVYVTLYNQLPPPPPPPPGGEPCDDGEPGKGGKEGEPSEPSDRNDDGNDGDDEGAGNDGGAEDEDDDKDGQGQGTLPRQPRRGDSKRGGRPDPVAEETGGFDEVMAPQVDPGTGKEDLPSEMEFVEAVARAAEAARMAGKMPDNLMRRVMEILEPQVNWKDHLRIKLSGKLGQARETWDSPNRRRICLNPSIYLPGRKGFGANLVAVIIDNSGSIMEPELRAFFGEAGAIITDCKPKKVLVMWCDSEIHRVEEARTLDELAEIRVKGSEGGGGTSFRPPFTYLRDKDIYPDALVYLTDMYPNDGWPDEPRFPVIWCATTEVEGPYGETVHIKIED